MDVSRCHKPRSTLERLYASRSFQHAAVVDYSTHRFLALSTCMLVGSSTGTSSPKTSLSPATGTPRLSISA